jgi:hypothetical protein
MSDVEAGFVTRRWNRREAQGEILAWEAVGFEGGFGPKGLVNLAQGGGFAEPWVPIIKARSSEGAKAMVQTRAVRRSRSTVRGRRR